VSRGSEADRKLNDAPLPDGEHDWSNVLVIGEHKQNPDEDRSAKTLVQLAEHAREVIGSQPERRFMPGFTICGSMQAHCRAPLLRRSRFSTLAGHDIMHRSQP